MKPTPLHPDASKKWIVTDPGDLFGHLLALLPATVDRDRLQTACMDIFAAALKGGYGSESDWRAILQLVIAGYAMNDLGYDPKVLL